MAKIASRANPGRHSVQEPDARYLQTQAHKGTLVDSCILIDVLADDPKWADWSLAQLELRRLADQLPKSCV